MELLRAIKINQATQSYTPTSSELVDMYGEAVYKFCRSMAYSMEEADDLFQETYLKAIESLPKIKESPQGFLLATAIYIYGKAGSESTPAATGLRPRHRWTKK